MDTQNGMACRLASAYILTSKILSALIGLIGFAAIIGWLYDIDFLKGIRPDFIPMKVNAAFAFILVSISLLLQAPSPHKTHTHIFIARLIALIIFLFGFLTLLEHLLKINLYIDQLFFQQQNDIPVSSTQGRIAPFTAVTFMLTGIALISLDVKNVVTQICSICIGIYGLLILIGTTYHSQITYQLAPYTYAAIHAGVNFILTSLAMLMMRPRQGIMEVFTSDTEGGKLVRVLSLVTIIVPVIIGYLRILGEYNHFYDNESGVTLYAIFNIIIFSTIIIFLATKLMRSDAERKRNEMNLAKSEALFRNAMEYSAVGVALLTPEGNWIKVNNAFCEMTGYTINEMLKFNYQDITYKADLENEIKLKDRILANEIKYFKIEKRYINKNGSLVWALLIVSGFFDENGTLIYFIDSVENIDKQKHMLIALEESEKRWKFALESANQGVWDWDVKAKKIIFSHTWKTMLGYDDNEIGNNESEFRLRIHPDDMATVEARLNDHFEGKTTEYLCEVRFRCKNGRYKWMLDRGKVISRDADGHVIRAIGTHTDISQMKEKEEQLEAAKANLERSNKELEQFAYVASHDLQEPLRMITSYVQLLERRYKDKLDTDANEFIQFAVDGSKHMQLLIDDLLNYARVTSKAKPFELSDSSKLLQQAVVSLQIQIKERDAHITNDALPDIHVDATQVQQLFQNLLSNAMKFCEKQPEIHIGVQENDSQWIFSVKDNGIGISADDIPKLFTIFKRLNPGDKYPGTGMGLAICKKIVERHGGRIWAESQPGLGTTFYFTIPK